MKNSKKYGFTLIELLAVIVILAIVALIATPIVLGIINSTKERAFEQSVNGIVRDAIAKSAFDFKGEEELVYKYENNTWIKLKLNLDGSIPKYIEIKVNKEGKTRYAITDGSYCALKEYDSKLTIKKISDENNDKKIQEQYCKLPTDDSCFKFDKEREAITHYYDYQGNNSSNEVCPKDVIIPEEIDGTPVTRIGSYTCYGCSIKSVTIPNSVKRIERIAFWGSSLENVIIPNSVTSIGQQAFAYSNKLKNITIADGVKSIDSGAFEHCNLTNVDIPDSVTYIGGGAFTDNQLPTEQAFIYNRNKDGSINYTSLNSYAGKNRDNVIIPSEVNGVELTSIDLDAFKGTSLKSITIPYGVKSIGTYAFYGNDLTSLTIPSSVMSIGYQAFYVNKLTSVIIKGKKEIANFTSYPSSSPFGWADGYSDDNIEWQS